MRVAAVIASVLAFGAAAMLQRRRRERDENAHRWSAATDAVGVRSPGGGA